MLAYCHVTDGSGCLAESKQLLHWFSLTSERIILVCFSFNKSSCIYISLQQQVSHPCVITQRRSEGSNSDEPNSLAISTVLHYVKLQSAEAPNESSNTSVPTETMN